MSNYYNINTGEPTTADDPDRGIWYGLCTYWTDDWAKVASGGIPCCPVCESPGFVIDAGEWFDDASQFEANGNPRYVEFVKQSKEQCRKPLRLLEWYRQWLDANPQSPA